MEEQIALVLIVTEADESHCVRIKDYTQGTHTKRQATQHDCLPTVPILVGDGDKRIEILMVYGEEKKYFYWADYRAAEAEQKSLVPAKQAKRINQGRAPFICTR